ncbi:hypothetical protein MPLA_680049 [Mesorhizobium sp. ORS 3359]|nr:hypothetical protein MPLA_680049 [Mesorhizobium sp. ORS 3359]
MALFKEADVVRVNSHPHHLTGDLRAQPGRAADKNVDGIGPATAGARNEITQTLPFDRVKAPQEQDVALLPDDDFSR